MQHVNRFTLIFISLTVWMACQSKQGTSVNQSDTPDQDNLSNNETVDEPYNDQKPTEPLPVISFDTTEHDFGVLKEGENVSYKYTFTNTGEAPLLIQSVRPSCGCTVPAWTKEPVPVGQNGFVEIEFNTAGKLNIQNKTVTVTANTWPETNTLRFKAMVTPKPTR